MTTTITNAKEGTAVKKIRMPQIVCMMDALQTLRIGRSPVIMSDASTSWVDSERTQEMEVDCAMSRVKAM